MWYRMHVVLMWLLGRLVWLARQAKMLESAPRLVLVWLDDERRHQPNEVVIEHCCLLLERCTKFSRLRIDLLWRYAFAFYRVGGPESIRRFLTLIAEARQIAEAYEYKGSTLGHIYGVLAIYHQQTLHDLDEALRMYHMACHELRGYKNRASTLIPYATLLRERGDYQCAQRWLEEAIAVARSKRHYCCARLELARVLHARHDLGGAHVELEIALRIARRHRYHDEEGDIHRELARILAKQGKLSEARETALRAEQCYRRAGSTGKAEQAAHMWRVEYRRQ